MNVCGKGHNEGGSGDASPDGQREARSRRPQTERSSIRCRYHHKAILSGSIYDPSSRTRETWV